MSLKNLEKASTPTYADTLVIHAIDATSGIEAIQNDYSNSNGARRIYDAAGRLMPQSSIDRLPKGLYIVTEGKRSKKLIVK